MNETPTLDLNASPGSFHDNPEPQSNVVIPLPHYPDWICRERRGEEFHNGYSFGRDSNKRWLTFRTNARLSVPELEQVLHAYNYGKNTASVEASEAQRQRIKKFLTENNLIEPLRTVLQVLMEAV